MKTYKKKTIKAIDKVYCDCCGKSTTNIEQVGPDFATLECCWGYGSPNDGTQFEIELCEECFYEVLAIIKMKRKQILGCFNYPYDADPLEGKEYLK